MSDACAIIPARGGSKRIPRKNIREFFGRPMIAWPIQTALDSGCFSRVIVSTDDEEIAEVALKWGAEVPFVRPAELADDHTGTRAVLRHAVAALEREGPKLDIIAGLYPTAVLLRCSDIRDALNMLCSNPQLDRVVAVQEYHPPIQRALMLSSENRLTFCAPEYQAIRTQDLPSRYHDAGSLYALRRRAVMELEPAEHIAAPCLLPRDHAVDIDTEEDLALAAFYMELRLANTDSAAGRNE